MPVVFDTDRSFKQTQHARMQTFGHRNKPPDASPESGLRAIGLALFIIVIYCDHDTKIYSYLCQLEIVNFKNVIIA